MSAGQFKVGDRATTEDSSVVLEGMQEVDHATFFARIGPLNATPRPSFVAGGRFMYSDFVDPYGRSHGRSLTDGNCVEPTRYAFPLAQVSP